MKTNATDTEAEMPPPPLPDPLATEKPKRLSKSVSRGDASKRGRPRAPNKTDDKDQMPMEDNSRSRSKRPRNKPRSPVLICGEKVHQKDRT